MACIDHKTESWLFHIFYERARPAKAVSAEHWSCGIRVVDDGVFT